MAPSHGNCPHSLEVMPQRGRPLRSTVQASVLLSGATPAAPRVQTVFLIRTMHLKLDRLVPRRQLLAPPSRAVSSVNVTESLQADTPCGSTAATDPGNYIRPLSPSQSWSNRFSSPPSIHRLRRGRVPESTRPAVERGNPQATNGTSPEKDSHVRQWGTKPGHGSR